MISTKPQLWVETEVTIPHHWLIISMRKNYKIYHVDGIYTANPELVLDAKRLNLCLIMKQMKWLILEQYFNAKTIIPCY
jgi:hypothetical protein